MVSIVVILLAAAPQQEAARLLVQDLNASGGVDPSIAQALTEAIGPEIDKRGFFKSVTSKDFQTLLGLERQKQLVGCSEGSTSCLTELAGALGAPYVLSGSVSKVGSALQLSLQMIDTAKAQPVARAIRIARNDEELRRTLPWALAEATGIPAPPSPSRAPAISLIGVGSALAVAGVALGSSAFLQENQLQHDLELGTTRTGLLDTAKSYHDRGLELAGQRSLALGLVVAGALAVGAGIYLMPSSVSGDVSVAMVPSGSGFALAGTFR